MDEKQLSEIEVLLQRYYDGELDDASRKKMESLLAGNEKYRESLRSYERLSALLQLTAPETSDEFARRRDWEKIASGLESTGSPRSRKITYWLGLAAAAALLIFFYYPFGAPINNETVVESIDCTYDSFLLLHPCSDDGHTIIWINDHSSTRN